MAGLPSPAAALVQRLMLPRRRMRPAAPSAPSAGTRSSRATRGMPPAITSTTSSARASSSGLVSTTTSAGAPGSSEGVGRPRRRAAVAPTASASRALDRKPRLRAHWSSSRRSPSPVSKESLPSSTSRPSSSSSRDAVRPSRNRFDVGHQTKAAPDARNRDIASPSIPTPWTAISRGESRPMPSSRSTSPVATALTPSATCRQMRGAAAGKASSVAMPSESSPAIRATRTGKSRSKSGSQRS